MDRRFGFSFADFDLIIVLCDCRDCHSASYRLPLFHVNSCECHRNIQLQQRLPLLPHPRIRLLWFICLKYTVAAQCTVQSAQAHTDTHVKSWLHFNNFPNDLSLHTEQPHPSGATSKHTKLQAESTTTTTINVTSTQRSISICFCMSTWYSWIFMLHESHPYTHILATHPFGFSARASFAVSTVRGGGGGIRYLLIQIIFHVWLHFVKGNVLFSSFSSFQHLLLLLQLFCIWHSCDNKSTVITIRHLTFVHSKLICVLYIFAK